MTEFTVNAGRVDPYKNFKFRVKWDGRYVAGVTLNYDSQCSSGALWFVVNIDVTAPTPAA